jgi:flagellar biosynthesis GTPase FlhF
LNDFKDLVDAEHTRVVAPDYATAVRILQERFGSDWTVVHSRKVRRPGLLGWIGLSDVVVIVRTQKSSNDILTTPIQLEAAIEEKIPVLAGDFSTEESETEVTAESMTAADSVSMETAMETSMETSMESTMETPVESEMPESPTAISESDFFSSVDSNNPSGFDQPIVPDPIVLNPSAANSTSTDAEVVKAPSFNDTAASAATGAEVTENFNTLSARLEGSRERIAEELRAFNSSSPFHREPDPWQTVENSSASQEADVVGIAEIAAEDVEDLDVYDDPVFLGKVSTVLERCGFSDNACSEIKSAVSRANVPENLDEAALDALIENRIGACVMGRIPEAGGISLAHTAGKTRFVALVGPTGVGKTTTLAKLAAYFHVVEKKKVGLITLDSYRLGAIEQLRRFADIIGLNFKTVDQPEKVREEIESFSKYDIVFIDTAGRSQKDVDRLREVRDCLSNVNDLEIHLCLSLGAAQEALMATADAFRIVGYDHVILTKRDESYSKGFLWDLFGIMQKPVSYVTCGQEVPEDFDAASREQIRDMILGAE